MNQARDIVVVGAALGGVTAIAKIAMTWPAALPVAVVVALATPDQPADVILQIVKTYAPVAVAYAIDGEAVALGKIVLSPPGKHLFVGTDGVLKLDGGNLLDTHRPSINRLFASAAAVFGPRVIGIVLSGDSKDGAQGLSDIEAAGGIGIVQAPDDAVEPRMPRHAIRHDHPRYCVEAVEIAPLVQRLMVMSRER